MAATALVPVPSDFDGVEVSICVGGEIVCAIEARRDHSAIGAEGLGLGRQRQRQQRNDHQQRTHDGQRRCHALSDGQWRAQRRQGTGTVASHGDDDEEERGTVQSQCGAVQY